MNAGNFRKKDYLLMSFAIFDIVNITLYLYAFFNMSLNSISIIFTVGICNLLFALWIMYRNRENQSNNSYYIAHGKNGIQQGSYYVRSVFIGALLILADFAVLPFAVFMILKQTVGSRVDGTMIANCHDSLGGIQDLDITNAGQFVLNHFSCFIGDGHMFTLVGPYDSDFLISLMQSIIEKLITHPAYYIYILYILCFISILPFIWLLYRMCHLVNVIRKGEEASIIRKDEKA